MPNIKDVANAAGVSTATVSNVLQGTKNVSSELRKRVMDAVEHLNYCINPIASGLKKSKMNTIGLILTKVDSQFFPYIIEGIQHVFDPLGYNISFLISNNRIALEKQHLRSLINSHIAGIILNSVVEKDDYMYFSMLSSLASQPNPVPIVSIERDISEYGIDSVIINNFQGGKMATSHLIEMGCSKIAHIAAPYSVPWGIKRTEGYKKTLEEHGIDYKPSFVSYGDFLPLSGYSQTRVFIQNSINFDSIFAANDLMAIGAIKAVMENHYRIPEDIKIIGFDNTFLSALISPSLSTINVPIRRIGEESAQILLNRIENRSSQYDPVRLELPINLIQRKSTNIEMDKTWDLY